MTREQLDALARRYLSARFDEIEARLCEPIAEHQHEQEVDHVADRASEVSYWLAHADYRYGLKHARTMLPAGADRETQRKLARRLLEVELEACKAHLRALDGEPLRIPFLGSADPLPKTPKETPRLSKVVDMYADDKLARRAWQPRTEEQNRGALAMVCELLGDPPIGDITKDTMRELAQLLPRVPSNFGKKFGRRNVREVIAELGDADNVPRLQAKTINWVLSATRSVFTWALENDKIASNPAIVMRDVKEARARDQRVPFADADIRAFMAQLALPTRRANGTDPLVLLWIARILALSGMRLGEVAQLRKVDICEVQCIPVFDINAQDGKSIKNYASVRVVPIHPRLLELGLLDYVAQRPGEYLWPEKLRAAKAANRSNTDELSRLLNRRLRAAGIDDARKTMHSFRHTVSARLTAASVPEYQIADILGHENESMTTGRYGGESPPHVKMQALSMLSLPI